MVKGNNYQEAEFNNASYKNNIEKKLKSQKRKEKFFAFLVYFFFSDFLVLNLTFISYIVIVWLKEQNHNSKNIFF
jgi:hypothetical protein